MRSAYKPAAPNAGIASQFTIKYYGPGVGELNVGLHHIAMATFYIKNTFEIPDRRLFVMAGSVVEGEVRVGMFLRVADIDNFEIAGAGDRRDTALRTFDLGVNNAGHHQR